MNEEQRERKRAADRRYYHNNPHVKAKKLARNSLPEVKEQKRQYYERNKEEILQKYSDLYYQRRQQIIDYLGGVCSHCNAVNDLQFDHINPLHKSFDISDRLAGHTVESMKEEIDKCQLLCPVCHMKKTTTTDRPLINQKINDKL